MSFLSKDDLWQVSSEIPYDDVELFDPDGNHKGTMRVRGMTADEAQRWQDAQMVMVGNRMRTNRKDATSKLVLMTVVNEDFTPYFDRGDLMKVSQMPAWILSTLAEAAMKLSGMNEDAKADLAEGFAAAQNEA